MKFASFAIVSFLALPLSVFATPRANGIDQSTYNNLERYTKYSSAVYQWQCPKPLGNKLVKSFNIFPTHGFNIFPANGFIARDDSRKEIIVAFRGTHDPVDAFVDALIVLTPLKSKGLSGFGNAQVHTGFLVAYNAVADAVLATVETQAAAYPSYKIVVTGHSLGGATASLASISIKSALPNADVKLYTFGQPCVGNAEFVAYVEKLIGTSNIFRAVHTYDGVPTILLKSFLRYRHFGTEYWHFKDPATASNVKKCTGGDDPTCSASIPSTFINPAHVVYFGHVMGLDPRLCYVSM